MTIGTGILGSLGDLLVSLGFDAETSVDVEDLRARSCLTIGTGILGSLGDLLASLGFDADTSVGVEDFLGIGVSERGRVSGVFFTSSVVPLLCC